MDLCTLLVADLLRRFIHGAELAYVSGSGPLQWSVPEYVSPTSEDITRSPTASSSSSQWSQDEEVYPCRVGLSGHHGHNESSVLHSTDGL